LSLIFSCYLFLIRFNRKQLSSQNKCLTEVSVRAELALLSRLFTKAKKEWGIPVDNPVAKIERPAPPKGRTVFLIDEEGSKLIDANRKARNKIFYYYVLTLLHTGIRALKLRDCSGIMSI